MGERIDLRAIKKLINANQSAQLRPLAWVCESFRVYVCSHFVSVFVDNTEDLVLQSFVNPADRDTVNSIQRLHRRVLTGFCRLDHGLIVFSKVGNDLSLENIFPQVQCREHVCLNTRKGGDNLRLGRRGGDRCLLLAGGRNGKVSVGASDSEVHTSGGALCGRTTSEAGIGPESAFDVFDVVSDVSNLSIGRRAGYVGYKPMKSLVTVYGPLSDITRQ